MAGEAARSGRRARKKRRAGMWLPARAKGSGRPVAALVAVFRSVKCGSEGFILRGDLLPPLLFVPSRGLFIALRGLGRCEFVREFLKAAFQKSVRVGKEVAMRYPLSLPALGLSTTRLAKKRWGFYFSGIAIHP